MPLLDIFRPPLSERTVWESFHSKWAVALASYLNRILPRRYSAEVQIHLGRHAEADVAEFDRGFAPDDVAGNGPPLSGGVAVQTWSPPTPTLLRGMIFPDDLEVHVNDLGVGGSRLIAIIELVCPGNKDWPDTRRAIGMKTAAYLQRGIGVAIVDAVTSKHFNLHNELIQLLGQDLSYRMDPTQVTYVSSYRPARRDEENDLDLWTYPLTVGQPLPTVPLALRALTTIPLDLELTYQEVVRNSRLD